MRFTAFAKQFAHQFHRPFIMHLLLHFLLRRSIDVAFGIDAEEIAPMLNGTARGSVMTLSPATKMSFSANIGRMIFEQDADSLRIAFV